VTAACRILGKSRSTLHRHRNPKPPAARERKEFHHPAELTPAEEERVLKELDSPRFAGKSVAQAYTILLDEGCYLCSQPAMHRLLRRRGTSGERRAHASRPARKKPELLAERPNQVWSWDITKLKGPDRGIWYLLYVIMDIYSRKVIHCGKYGRPRPGTSRRSSSSMPSRPTTASGRNPSTLTAVRR
jgi:putative transposase